MPKQIDSYWELIEPLFSKVDTGKSPKDFFASTSEVPRPVLLLFAAHFCLSEVHNGGFLQFLWNSTGILAPEAVAGFIAIGMPHMASIVTDAAAPLGSPYPRDRDERMDALLTASDRSGKELRKIFKSSDNFYLAFAEATESLAFDELSKLAMDCAKTENGGFQAAATAYANTLHLIQ